MTSPIILGDPALVEAPATIGRKAQTLHRLLRAGLPVPRAIALSPSLARESAVLKAAARDIGYPVAVRSSANVEDMREAAAPGLFETVLDVGDDDALVTAAAQVLASAQAPLVSAYLQARNINEMAEVAVIIQRQIHDTLAQGVLYTRAPGQPTGSLAIVETPGFAPLWIDRDTGEPQERKTFPLSTAQGRRLWRLASHTEKLLGHEGGIDLEWIWDEEGPHILQARPIVHRKDQQSTNHPYLEEVLRFSRKKPKRIWRLDATHNPLPLSPAQAGLVEQVRDLAPYEMRVVGGYLYTAAKDLGDEPLGPSGPTPEPLAENEVRKIFASDMQPKMDAALATVEATEAPTLGDALSVYKQVFVCLTTELAPMLAADAHEGANPLSIWIARTLAGHIDKRELLRKIGAMAPAWDVAVPTYGESPEQVERALSVPLDTSTANAAMKESLREADDLFFYRAQRAIRLALLALARKWRIGDLIFYIPLGSLLSVEDSKNAPPALVAEAKLGKKRREEQLAQEMPLAFAAGVALPRLLPIHAEIWRGVGTGGYVVGRVERVEGLSEFTPIQEGSTTVLVMPTVTPAHALAARGAVAVVCEYGEHLGHGAAMARELGIPCIVGCARAWRDLCTGDQVAVHGSAGLVTRLNRV